MAGKTISAYTDTDTAESVAHLAKLEHRTQAQIAGMALKFFVVLPTSARTAWYQINALGDQVDLEEVTREITRTLINAQYKIAQRQVVEQMKIENSEQLETEDDLISAAVTLTSDE